MTPWVLRLIVANVVVFFLEASVPGVKGWGELVPALMLVRPWTLVTYMFLHAGAGHILFNMLGLYFFGPRLEVRLGGSRFLALYFTSGIAGALLSLFTPYVPIIGASGAIFGVFYGYARFWPRDRIYVWGVFPIEAWLFVIIMTVVSLAGAGGFGERGIAHFTHLGGFVGGFLYCQWLERYATAARFRAKATAAPPARSADLDRWRRIRREALHPVNQEELDRVLGKLAAAGASSLTADERAFLDRFSRVSGGDGGNGGAGGSAPN